MGWCVAMRGNGCCHQFVLALLSLHVLVLEPTGAQAEEEWAVAESAVTSLRGAARSVWLRYSVIMTIGKTQTHTTHRKTHTDIHTMREQ